MAAFSCSSPVECEAVGDNDNFGRSIETLSAPPDGNDVQHLAIGTIGVPYQSSLSATGGNYALRHGPSAREAFPPAST